MDSITVLEGEDIYAANKEKWQKNYPEKIIAIDVESKDLAGYGDDLDAAYKCILEPASKEGRFYFRKVGPIPATAHLPWVGVMLLPVEKYDMRKGQITLIGPRGTRNLRAYIDPSGTKTVVAESVADELGLPCAGYTQILGSAGKDLARLFSGRLVFYGDEFDILILGEHLPDRVPIKVMVGSDVVGSHSS